jgi:hypothetical protein
MRGRVLRLIAGRLHLLREGELIGRQASLREDVYAERPVLRVLAGLLHPLLEVLEGLGKIGWLRSLRTAEFSQRITQDFPLLAGAEDQIAPPRQFFRQLTALLFTREEHAHNHCQIGNVTPSRDRPRGGRPHHGPGWHDHRG